MDVNTKHCTQIFKCVIDLLEATHNLVTARFPSVKLSISAHGAQNKGKPEWEQTSAGGAC